VWNLILSIRCEFYYDDVKVGLRVKVKYATCYSASYMSQTRDQKRFDIRMWQLIGMS